MTSPLTFGVLVALAVWLFFIAVWRMLDRRDAVDERLAAFSGVVERDIDELYDRPRRRLPLISAWINRSRWGPKLARALYRAALPLTPAEFVLIVLLAGLVGFGLGSLGFNLFAGLLLGAAFGFLPVQWMRFVQNRRRRAFTDQLPDVLSLLTGALRSGYGLTASIQHLVEQMRAPASEEFGRTLQALELGADLPVALDQMVERVGSDDLEMMVLAVKVQQEVGGNLAETLESIAETIRERIRIHREVRALTAQQRLTGYILAAEPLVLVGILYMANSSYFDPFFEPGMLRLLPMAALGMMMLAFVAIGRIVDIEV
jgi:tight adherence protein B